MKKSQRMREALTKLLPQAAANEVGRLAKRAKVVRLRGKRPVILLGKDGTPLGALFVRPGDETVTLEVRSVTGQSWEDVVPREAPKKPKTKGTEHRKTASEERTATAVAAT